MTPAMKRAFWAGDTDSLRELAPCRCCCAEHTFERCPARAWYGCRGQGNDESAERQSWERVLTARGMSLEQFYS